MSSYLTEDSLYVRDSNATLHDAYLKIENDNSQQTMYFDYTGDATFGNSSNAAHAIISVIPYQKKLSITKDSGVVNLGVKKDTDSSKHYGFLELLCSDNDAEATDSPYIILQGHDTSRKWKMEVDASGRLNFNVLNS